MAYECVGCGKSHQSSKSLGAHKSQCKRFKNRQKRNDKPTVTAPVPEEGHRNNEAGSSSGQQQDTFMNISDDEQLVAPTHFQAAEEYRPEKHNPSQNQVRLIFSFFSPRISI
jgi:hypothetical protein